MRLLFCLLLGLCVGIPQIVGAQAAPAVGGVLPEAYVGTYQLSDNATMTISNKGAQLLAQLTGQDAFEIYPTSQTEFYYKVVVAKITFDFANGAVAKNLTLHQNGRDLSAPRIDEGMASRIAEATSNRKRNQSAYPGGATTVSNIVHELEQSSPALQGVAPTLGDAIEKQLPAIRAQLGKLGRLQSVDFVGVDAQGADTYLLKHEHGAQHAQVVFNSNGAVSGLFFSP